MHNLNLHPIRNTETLSRQGQNHSSTSLIDGFYTNISNHKYITCTTLLHQHQNSDHYQINVVVGSTTLAQKVHKPITHTPRITYPISPEKIQQIYIEFQEATNLTIQSLTQKLHTTHLNRRECEDAQETFQDIINTLSICIKATCLDTQTPNPLSHRTRQQGGFFPRKQQKLWKSHLKIYYTTRKTTCTVHFMPCISWPSHQNIQQLYTLKNIHIPPPPPMTQPSNNGSE